MPGRFLILHQSLQAPLRHSWFFFWDHAALGSLSLLTPGTQVTGYRPQTEPGWPELCQCICGTAKQEAGLNPWVGKIPWSRKWQPTPVFLSGEFHGQGSLAGYHPWGHKGSDTTEATWHIHTLAGNVTFLPFLPNLSRCIQWEVIKRYISMKQSSIHCLSGKKKKSNLKNAAYLFSF